MRTVVILVQWGLMGGGQLSYWCNGGKVSWWDGRETVTDTILMEVIPQCLG